MPFYSDDPVADAERYFAEQDKQLQKRPICCMCDEHIQDETAYYINGEYICIGCLNDNFKIYVDDYTD